MKWVSLLFLVGVIFLSTSPSAAEAPLRQDPPSVSELLRTIQKNRDGTDPVVFEELAQHASSAALKALDRALGVLRDETQRERVYDALAAFAGVEALAPRALSLVEREVRRAKSAPSRLAAAHALLAFDPLDLARELAVEHRDPLVRGLLGDALVVVRAASEDPSEVQAILQGGLSLEGGVHYLGIDPDRAARLAQRPHREVVREALAALQSRECRAVLARALGDPKLGRLWKLLLLRLLVEERGPEVDAAFATACRDADGTVALLAIDLLARRVDQGGRAEILEGLLDHREAAVRRAALAALGRIAQGDAAFRRRLSDWAGDSDPALRMGAAAALAEVRTPEAVATLVGMIPDEEWSVRAEVLAALLSVRPKAAIPILIERLESEPGRLAADVHSTLVGITGQDLGRRADPWRRWWQGEGERFHVPGRAAAQRALDRRAAAHARSKTAAAPADFYRIEVESERVVFVLDISGSMRLPAKSVGRIERSRMDLAKEELSEVLRKLPDGTRFNLIFFEEEVHAFARRTQEMNRSQRAKALRFVADQYAIGSTALYPALKLAFQDPLVDTIYLLSDGAPTVGEITDIEEIRAEVARWNGARHVRIHGISMGQDSTLLRWLCEDTGGSYRRVD